MKGKQHTGNTAFHKTSSLGAGKQERGGVQRILCAGAVVRKSVTRGETPNFGRFTQAPPSQIMPNHLLSSNFINRTV
jgi:hypothetical protein